MRQTLVTLSLLLIGINSYSQDMIITHNSDTINCTVQEIQEFSIKYKYPNEDVVNTISKNTVARVLFTNGRVQIVSEKVIITGKQDWEKVQITNNESDVIGLDRIGEIDAKANGGSTLTNAGKMQKKALKKLKEEGAKRGAHVILILTQTTKNGSFGLSGAAKASFRGIAYGYSKN